MPPIEENEIMKRAGMIRLVVLDVDGVLTDGKIIFTEDGKELKNFDVKDGHGIVMARDAGIQFAFISGRTSAVTAKRAENLGVKYVLQGAKDKEKAMRDLADTAGFELSAAAFMGDDVIDIPAMRIAGLAAAPADAHPAALDAADWVSSKDGGNGAAREFIDLMLKSRRSQELPPS
ncbi:MAG: KdsC family phosphatase [Candidatus Nitrospinota bacterium M3_3B_026]